MSKRSRPMPRWSALLRRASLAAAAMVLLVPAPAAAALRSADLGVYHGAANAAAVREFETWLGSSVRRSVDFLGGGTWESIESPTWWTSSWGASAYRTTYSVPLIPDTGGTLAEGATGAYNEHFVRLAQTLVASGEGDAVLRLGWEFNGDWYRWSAKDDPEAYAAYWRQVVTVMRSVPGAAFLFDWCPVLGKGAVAPPLAYPGDAYVDYIGLDVYDQDWYPGWEDPVRRWENLLSQPYGLRWHRDFAAAHRKPMSFPEFGLAIRPDGHGGGDNPYFIQKMFEWIEANDVAYASYFEHDAPDGQHALLGGRFPLGAERFRALFGPAAAPPPTPASSAVSPPSSLRLPGIDGYPARNATLKATTGTWAGSAPFSYAFRWLRCDRSGAACRTISGANATTFVPRRADVGHTLRVVVTATNAAGSRSATSPATRVVAARWGSASTGGAVRADRWSSLLRLLARRGT